MSRETFDLLMECLVGLVVIVTLASVLYMLTACSADPGDTNDHERFLKDMCRMSGGTWIVDQDQCIEPKN